MGDGGAVSKRPSDPRSGLTCIVRLWESTFALRAINEQTFLNLRTTEHASENVKVARHLRRQRSGEFLAEEKRKMDNTIWQTQTAVYSLAKLLEPARVDRVDMYGDEKISLSTKGLWVLNDSPEITSAFNQVQVAHEALDEVIGSLQSPRKPESTPPGRPTALDTLSTEFTSRPPPYSASQLLAWRRQSRMRLRNGDIPLKTEGLGVQDGSGVEVAINPPDSHRIESTSPKGGAALQSSHLSQRQQHDQSQEQDNPSTKRNISGISETQYRIPPKSPSRVTLQTQYPSPPESDTGSSPRAQHYPPASSPTQNQYYSPPQSSHGNSPQSQHQTSPRNHPQAFAQDQYGTSPQIQHQPSPRNHPQAPLQDQYGTSLQTAYQNIAREKLKDTVGTQQQSTPMRHFEVMSEIEYQPRLPRGYVAPQNPNELPPERQYHIPQSFLVRTQSNYRDNAGQGDPPVEGFRQAHHDQQTPQTQPNQAFPQTAVRRQQRQQQQQQRQQQQQQQQQEQEQEQRKQREQQQQPQQRQNHLASPRLRFLDQQDQKPLIPPSPQTPRQYHNPGPFFLGQRDRPQHSRTSSEPTNLPIKTHSRRGYPLPMVFEENLYGGLEVVGPAQTNPVANSSPSPSQLQLQDPYKRPEVVDAELESVSTQSQSQHEPVMSFSANEPANRQSVSQEELNAPYWSAQQEPPTTHFESQLNSGPPPSLAQQEPLNTYSEPQYNLGNAHPREQRQPSVTPVQAQAQAHSRFDLGNPYYQRVQQQPIAVTHSRSQYDLSNPYWQQPQQQEHVNSRSQSHPQPQSQYNSVGDPYSQPQPQQHDLAIHPIPSQPDPPSQYMEGIKHTQSLNEANNPYARLNKRKSWLLWQASRSVMARGLNDRYSL